MDERHPITGKVGSTQPANKWLAVFTSPLGHLRDPSNTQADLRDVFDRVGYPDITSHTFRRTVATLMDQAGLTGLPQVMGTRSAESGR